MDLNGVLEVGKWLLSATGLTSIFLWVRETQRDRQIARANLYELSAEIQRSRALLMSYLRNIRAHFHHQTAIARFQEPPHILRDAIREVLPDERLAEIGSYLYSGVGKGNWFYRVGPPDWPIIRRGDQAIRRQTALRFLSDPRLLDHWDLAMEELEGNRDGLAEEWRRVDARPWPKPTEEGKSSVRQEDVDAAASRGYEYHVYGVIELAAGLLVGADTAERIGAELAEALQQAVNRTDPIPKRIRRWAGTLRPKSLPRSEQAKAQSAAIAHSAPPEANATSRSAPLHPRDLLLFPGQTIRIPGDSEDAIPPLPLP